MHFLLEKCVLMAEVIFFQKHFFAPFREYRANEASDGSEISFLSWIRHCNLKNEYEYVSHKIVLSWFGVVVKKVDARFLTVGLAKK